MKVAVIGAGAAGLVAARELARAGHGVTVFEQSQQVGGIWVYRPDSEPDPLGQTGQRIHASMHESMRTNLPRDVMAFFDFTFDSAGGGADDWLRYPGHGEVLLYLQRFAHAFSVYELIRFDSRVVRAVYEDHWLLTYDRSGHDATESFDALAVCNGHYIEPRVPDIPGMACFPGTLLHSHNYRTPAVYEGADVAVLGAASSGADLSQEISGVAQQVYWCGAGPSGDSEVTGQQQNIILCGAVKQLLADGRLEFEDGSLVGPVSHLVFATGYHYRFSFLSEALIRVSDNWVTPLCRDLLCIEQQTLALIGLPFKIIPFPIFEIQSRWFAHMLNGEVKLPAVDEMHRSNQMRVDRLRQAGISQRNFHALDSDQYDYYDLLAGECGEPPLPVWYRTLGQASREHVRRWPESFRDRFLDAHGSPTCYLQR